MEPARGPAPARYGLWVRSTHGDAAYTYEVKFDGSSWVMNISSASLGIPPLAPGRHLLRVDRVATTRYCTIDTTKNPIGPATNAIQYVPSLLTTVITPFQYVDVIDTP